MPNLVESMKRAAVEAVEASNPCRVVTGKVVSAEPVQIAIDQKITLGTNQLILSKTVANNLASGDEVIMIRQAGGQQYFVIDWRG